MRATIRYEIFVIAVSMLLSEVFRRQFVHVYRTGRSSVWKSLGLGIAGLATLWALVYTFVYMLPERTVPYAVQILVWPVLLISFPAGCALVAGIFGFDSERRRAQAVFAAGLVSVTVEYFMPVPGRVIYSFIFVYGLGAALIALRRPIPPEDPLLAPERPSGGISSDLPQGKTKVG